MATSRSFGVVLTVLLVGACLQVSAQSPAYKARRPVELHLAESMPEPGLIEMRVAKQDDVVYVRPEILLDDRDMVSASQFRDEARNLTVGLRLKPGRMARLNNALGKKEFQALAVVVAGKAVAAPVMVGRITGDILAIHALDKPEADALVTAVNKP